MEGSRRVLVKVVIFHLTLFYMGFFNAAQPGVGRVLVLGSKQVQAKLFVSLQNLERLGLPALGKYVGRDQGGGPRGYLA